MAEAYLNSRAPDHLLASSAAVNPAPCCCPLSIAALEKNGIATAGLAPKSPAALEGTQFDFVFALIDTDLEDDVAFRSGFPLTAVWTIPPPPVANINREDHFAVTIALIKKRVDYFQHLSIAQLENLARLTRRKDKP